MIEFKKNREIFTFLYNKIEGAKKSIKIAVAWFTDPELSKILLEKQNNKVDVKIILFNHHINSLLGDRMMFKENLRLSNVLRHEYIMHHKFCVIDDQIVITGSYNWTVNARRFNRENILCIEDAGIVEEFNKEFDSLFKNSAPQTQVELKNDIEGVVEVENLELLKLEKGFNEEIYQKIHLTEVLKIGVNIGLAYDLVKRHTPVIASKKLAEADDGKTIQSGLRKAAEANRLDLSFEESILNSDYALLFDGRTREFAREKLTTLGFFSNSHYSKLWSKYN